MALRRNRIPAIIADFEETVAEALDGGAQAIANDAKARVPVDSGRLRNAIRVVSTGETERVVVAGDDDAYYGHMVENGTTTQPPRPFLMPAFEANREGVEQRIRVALKRTVDRGGRG